jgi:hypothetical protein
MDQFNSNSKEYDRLGLHMVDTTTKYRDALLELKATKEDIAKLKEELYITATDLIAANEETAILKGISLLTEMQATLDDNASQKK